MTGVGGRIVQFTGTALLIPHFVEWACRLYETFVRRWITDEREWTRCENLLFALGSPRCWDLCSRMNGIVRRRRLNETQSASVRSSLLVLCAAHSDESRVVGCSWVVAGS